MPPLTSLRNRCRCTRGLFNVLSMGIAFFFVFTAFNTCQNFMTLSHGKIGFASLSILYWTFAVCNFISPFLVLKCGPRVMMLAGALCFCSMLASNWANSEPFILVCSAITGFGAAIIWTAQGSYLSRNADADTLGFFNGLFWALLQTSGIVGNFLAGVLLQQLKVKYPIFFMILTFIACAGVLALFVPRRAPQSQEASPYTSTPKLLAATAQIIIDRRMLRLHVIHYYTGLAAALFAGSFPRVMGKKITGYAMTGWGVAEIVGSLISGKLSDHIGRVPVMCGACVLELVSCALTLFSFYFGKHAPILYYITCAIYGLADSTLNTQVFSTLPLLFSDRTEPAFACFRCFQAVGYAITYLYSAYLPFPYQAVIFGVVCIAGTCLYCTLYQPIRNQMQKKKIMGSGMDDGSHDANEGDLQGDAPPLLADEKRRDTEQGGSDDLSSSSSFQNGGVKLDQMEGYLESSRLAQQAVSAQESKEHDTSIQHV